MAGLIWLWQNIKNVPPIIIYTDVGISPQIASVSGEVLTLLYDNSDVDMEMVESIVPLIELSNPSPTVELVDKTSTVATATTTTYNQSGVSYNSSSQVYGGVGASRAPAPQFYKIGNK